MSMHGFVTEDDLILYAMHVLSPAEMQQVAEQVTRDAELAVRLTEIESVLGLYATANAPLEEVPTNSLQRLLSTVERERIAETQAESRQHALAERTDRASGSKWNFGLPWVGWALAAALLVCVGLLAHKSREPQQQTASQVDGSRGAQAEVASLKSERDQLRSDFQQQQSQVAAEREAAAQARRRADALSAKAAALNAKATEADQESKRAAARIDALTAAAAQTEAERRQLGEALTKEQQIAAAAAESQQVLAALADPTALHVTLTEPKEKKRPSGRGTYLASTGTLVFTGSNLAGLPSDKVYELWLMPADGSAPIPAGTFTPDKGGNATVISPKFQRVAAAGFAVTVEKAGGSQTPTMPIVLVGLS